MDVLKDWLFGSIALTMLSRQALLSRSSVSCCRSRPGSAGATRSILSACPLSKAQRRPNLVVAAETIGNTCSGNFSESLGCDPVGTIGTSPKTTMFRVLTAKTTSLGRQAIMRTNCQSRGDACGTPLTAAAYRVGQSDGDPIGALTAI